eukprot:CAMPEP_0198114540 /NCGR_PEP_ID=MMETSP1442-20131203/5893_1 /TAXON_ID= /ORGANISM="Craspedostauros australis, Strain CCMP3328" /LENGTH=90 /DNA_ID=CAMNT_0043771867 /DNA_START=814 /DNA_END=1086 /DNA_ORIENTATION=+
MTLPQAGAQAIPQQLCPALMYAPSKPGTGPMYGRASGGHGLIQAWTRSSSPTLSYSDDMPWNAIEAASTRLSLALHSSRKAPDFKSSVLM